MISRDNNLLNISKLCKVADVSRSGFYSWRKNKDKREAKSQEKEYEQKGMPELRQEDETTVYRFAAL